MADTMADLGASAELEPALERKVYAFGAVETHIEPGVIAAGIGDDILVLVVDEHVDVDAVIGEL